jgi:G:T-mismatch repair DNA endonuclease (very short patch repair protein)
MEQTNGCLIMHDRNGREVRLPKIPQYSVDGYCPETRNVFEFYVCFYHGCLNKNFRDVKMLGGETLAERYERTISRFERIIQPGYTVVDEWDCKWARAKITEQKHELLKHPIVSHSSLQTRDAL